MAKKLRAVLDTNVLVSALLAHRASPPRRIYQAFKEQRFILVSSPGTLHEVGAVLERPHFARNYNISAAKRKTLLKELKKRSDFVTKLPQVDIVPDDPDDNKFIACAVAGNADYIVSGDKHLLNVRDYAGIKVLNPRQFVRVLDHT